MHDIPVFTTDNGVASLTLKEIPYKNEAYIKMHDACDPDQLLKDCCDFCHAAGAEHIYATGNSMLEKYPYHTAIWKMSRLRLDLPETDAVLFPVQEQTLEQWRTLYNERMRSVPNAATMTLDEGRKLLDKGNGYFVHKHEKLLGIGIAGVDVIDAIVAAVPGAGSDVLSALNHALTGDRISVEVASTNEHAVRFYRKLGFMLTEEISRWYKIF